MTASSQQSSSGITAPTPKPPRLSKLTVRNFRAIGKSPVEIELDDIVVLVGPNNSGKSSILKAYELVMLGESKAAHLQIEDFPNHKIENLAEDEYPEIILETEVFDLPPAAKWIKDSSGRKIVKERWL